MKTKFAVTFCLVVFALALSVPAMAGDLYNNLGTGTNVYNCCTGWTVGGSGTLGIPFTAANEFTPSAGFVETINIGIGYVTGTNSFDVGIYTVGSNGLPGTLVPNASWTGLSSGTTFGQCCGLVSIAVNSTVQLQAVPYYLVISPTSLTSTTWEAWNDNSTGATGIDLFSNDGGMTWTNNGTQTLGAFEIVQEQGGTTPEPSSLLLLGTGVLGIVGTIRRKMNR